MSYATAVTAYNVASESYSEAINELGVKQLELNRAWELEAPRVWTPNVTQIRRISDNVVFIYAGLFDNNKPDDPQQLIYVRADLNTNPVYGGNWALYQTV